MMLLVFFLELFAFYILSQWLTNMLYMFFLLMTKTRSVAIMFILLLQFPGTVVHELAHLFTASILGVPAGKLTLVPENIRDTDIKSGSVSIAASDPFRRYAIGLAPVFAGILILTAIAYFLPDLYTKTLASKGDALQGYNLYLLIGAGYLMFSVSNAMFSSKEDLKGFVPFAIALGLLVGALYVAGVRIGLTGEALILAMRILTTLIKSLGVVLGINMLFLVISALGILVLKKLHHTLP